MVKDLVQIIKDNPGCVAEIDNDYWVLWRVDPTTNGPEDADKWDDWADENKLAEAGKVKELGDGGYGSGNCYGGDMLQALAQIVGMKIMSV